MNDATPEPPHHHGLREDLARLAGEHAAHAERRQEDRLDAELAADEREADFDLGRDVARPELSNAPTDFDLAKDVGAGNEPPELRDW